MSGSKVHESSEVIYAFLNDLLTNVSSYVMANDEYTQKHGLKLLRWTCRASIHGRIPKGMRKRYEGVLKNLRPHILAIQRSGRTIPLVVSSELDRILRKRG